MKMSRIESAIRIVLEFKDAFNRRDVAGLLSLLTDDCVFENASPAPDGAVISGKIAIAQFYQDHFSELPQATIEVEDIFGLGLRCVMRWKLTWTDAAGQQGFIRGVDIFQVRNGFICEKLSYVKG